MYSEKYQQIIAKQAEPVGELLKKADADITGLQIKLSNATAEIEQLKAAKCPKCSSPLPADGSACIRCRCEISIASTPKDAYLLGAKAFALAFAKTKAHGPTPATCSSLELLYKLVEANHGNTDIVAASDRIAAAMCKEFGKGHAMDPQRGPDDFFDKLFQQLFYPEEESAKSKAAREAKERREAEQAAQRAAQKGKPAAAEPVAEETYLS